MSDKTLEHRIADAFENPEALSSSDLIKLLEEVKVGADDAAKAKEEADRVAMNPATRPEAVREARSVSEDASFRASRFAKAVEGLQDLVTQARTREANARAAAEQAKAIAERDALAEELQKEWPKLAGKMVDLLDRLKRSNERCASLSGEERGSSAQAIAAGNKFIRHGVGDLNLVQQARVPAFIGAPKWPLDV